MLNLSHRFVTTEPKRLSIVATPRMTFMEETVGENLIRSISFSVAFVSAFAGVGLFWVYDDVISGSAIIILTGKIILTGDSY